MKIFRDLKNRFILTYWVLNKGEDFYTCNLNHLEADENGLVEDLGCTFHTSGKATFEDSVSRDIIPSDPGTVFNKRHQKSLKITALEDNMRFCYCLDINSLHTVNDDKPDEIVNKSKRKVIGKHINLKAGEIVELFDPEKDNYIFNPFLNCPPSTINYKFEDEKYFSNLDHSKCLLIEAGKKIEVQSVLTTYLPMFHCVEK